MAALLRYLAYRHLWPFPVQAHRLGVVLFRPTPRTADAPRGRTLSGTSRTVQLLQSLPEPFGGQVLVVEEDVLLQRQIRQARHLCHRAHGQFGPFAQQFDGRGLLGLGARPDPLGHAAAQSQHVAHAFALGQDVGVVALHHHAEGLRLVAVEACYGGQRLAQVHHAGTRLYGLAVSLAGLLLLAVASSQVSLAAPVYEYLSVHFLNIFRHKAPRLSS